MFIPFVDTEALISDGGGSKAAIGAAVTVIVLLLIVIGVLVVVLLLYVRYAEWQPAKSLYHNHLTLGTV